MGQVLDLAHRIEGCPSYIREKCRQLDGLSDMGWQPSDEDEFYVWLFSCGVTDAFGLLEKKYLPWISTEANIFYLPGGENADLFNIARTGFLMGTRNYRPGRASFWIFARNCIHNHLKTAINTANRRKQSPLTYSKRFEDLPFGQVDALTPMGFDNTETVIVRLYSKEALDVFIKRLSKKEKVVWDKRSVGQSYGQIAEAMSCDTKSIDNAMVRIKNKAEQFLSLIRSEPRE